MEAALAAAFKVIASSGISLAEAKFLRRTAVVAALSPAAAGVGNHVDALQAVLASAGAGIVPEAKAALRSRGAGKLAAKLGRHNKLRNADAQLDFALAREMAEEIRRAGDVLAKAEIAKIKHPAPRRPSGEGRSRGGLGGRCGSDGRRGA
jgi:hypothetical protein